MPAMRSSQGQGASKEEEETEKDNNKDPKDTKSNEVEDAGGDKTNGKTTPGLPAEGTPVNATAPSSGGALGTLSRPVRETPQMKREANLQLERSCWDWVSGLKDPDANLNQYHVRRAYRLHFPVHLWQASNCKRNCRGNPKCYCQMGETQWTGAETDDSEANASEELMEDIELTCVQEQRQQETPAGLKNLGNTCYVNSFLQIWFHNLNFRRALYDWEPGQDEEESRNETLLEAENYQPRGKVAALQALFSHLEYTNRRAADPNDLIAKLGLDPQVQQDAQEFSKLFMNLLEQNLDSQSAPHVKTLIQTQFMGRYAYVTRCCNCGKESKSPSPFYELDLTLQGNKTLADCLNDFTRQEKLTGDNQYNCESCQSKQNAVRSVRLQQLPPVLNLQINRFIFDMQTGRKKKLNSALQFPEELDVSEYLGSEENGPEEENEETEEEENEEEKPLAATTPAGRKRASKAKGEATKAKKSKKVSKKSAAKKSKTLYRLTGVLMHVGAEASHGHYIAHIQETSSGKWYKFSDTIVEPIEGKTPRLGSESDPMAKPGPAKATGGKVPAGFHSSNSAYMLVYMESSALEALRKEEEEKEERKREVKAVALERLARIQQRKSKRSEKEARMRQKAIMENGGKKEPDKVKEEIKKEEDEKKPLPVSNGRTTRKSNGGSKSNNATTNGKKTPKEEHDSSSQNGSSQKEDSSEEDLDTEEEDEDEEEEGDYVFVNGLVYPSEFPLHLRAFVEHDRSLFNEELQEILSEKEERYHERSRLRHQMRALLKIMPYVRGDPEALRILYDSDEEEEEEDEYEDDEAIMEELEMENEDPVMDQEFEFVPADWLAKYLKNPMAASVIETTNLLCVHSCLDLDKLNEVKLVRKRAADKLYADAGEGEGRRLHWDKALCKACVKNRCKRTKLNVSSMRDAKILTEWLKEGCDDSSASSGFWVGKNTLKKWRQFAKDDLSAEISAEAERFLEAMEMERRRQRRRYKKRQHEMRMARMISEDEDEDEEESYEEEDSEEEDDDPYLMEEEEEEEEEVQVIPKVSKVNGNSSVSSPVNNKAVMMTNGNKAPVKRKATPVMQRQNNSQGKRSAASAAPTTLIKPVEKKPSSPAPEMSPMDLAEVQSRLEKIGTNISFAKVSPPKPPSAPASTGSTSSKPARASTSSTALSQNGSGTSSTRARRATPNEESVSNGSKLFKCDLPSSPSNTAVVASSSSSSAEFFNSDIICAHGNLCHDMSKRRVVSPKIWAMLKKYFPRAKTFPKKKESCEQCKATSSEQAEANDQRRDMASSQKSALSDIFNERNRPSWAKSTLNKVFLISRAFVHEWRNFASAPTKRDMVSEISNETLLCKHGGLLYPIRLDTESDKESIVYLTTQDEWTSIQSFFTVDHEISVTRNKEAVSTKGDQSEKDLLVSKPSVCKECLDQRLEAEEQDRLRYKNAKVFVRRVSDKNLPCADPSDPEFGGDTPPSKKKNGVPSLPSPVDVRRSNRRQKVRGEKEVLVSSDMLLRDFKVKLMDLFKVPPFDQNLFYDGSALTDSSKTLGELRVLPSSLLYLKADEVLNNSNGSHLLASSAASSGPNNGGEGAEEESVPEEGFKGTGLLSGF